jgi:hypothetical protein
MTPERWQQIRDVLAQALEASPSQRVAVLDRACSSDHSLRQEVESLLSSGEKICSSFLQPSAPIIEKLSGQFFSPESTPQASNPNPPTGKAQKLRWYVFLLAGISIVGNLFLAYYDVFGLRHGGLSAEEHSGGVYITSVEPTEAADKAGLVPGDRIVQVNQQPVGTLVDWTAQRMNFEANRPIPIVVERNHQAIRTTLRVRGLIWNQYTPSGRVENVTFLLGKLITLSVGLFIVFKNPPGFVARLGGWVLVVMATIFVAFPWGFAATLRSLPSLIALPVVLVYDTAAFRTPLLLAFFCLFPQKLFTNRWAWGAFCTGPALATVYGAYLLLRTIYDPGHLESLAPYWALVAMTVQSLVYLLGVLVALPLSYSRLESLTDRRRLRVLCVGATVGLLSYLPLVASPLFKTSSVAVDTDLLSPFLSLVSVVGYSIFPFAFAYAILRHRLFDIQVIVRRGLQYALARQSSLALLPTIACLVTADILLHGRIPLFTVLRNRGPIYLGTAIFAGIVITRRQQWLAALDRRFFRDKYDAQQLFRDIVEKIRAARTIDQVSPLVVERITDALHTKYCAIILRNTGEAYYQVLALSPHKPLPQLDNGLMDVLHSRRGRLPAGTAKRLGLSKDSAEVLDNFLIEADADLLVPVSVQEGIKEAFLVLGAKLSEEPYSREDLALLDNVAAALALLIERAPATFAGRVFEECPDCGRCYDSGAEYCENNGAALKLVASPRILSNRYRLEQRLGEGGMGTVYRASDLALGRGVALKMIKEQLSGDFQAIRRFRREAQISAHFAHANIVTVFDFGIEADDRAFLVMELLRGTTLREELRIHKKLEPARTLIIFEQICAGVSAAHAMGVVHRDLKPENIFLDASRPIQQVKITDFGIAKSFRQPSKDTVQTRTGVVIGTFDYMSPEQLSGQKLSPMWDIWALSVIAFESLCGTTPLSGGDVFSHQDIGSQIQQFPGRTSLATLSLRKFFEETFHPAEAMRPQTVAAFWENLRNALA